MPDIEVHGDVRHTRIYGISGPWLVALVAVVVTGVIAPVAILTFGWSRDAGPLDVPIGAVSPTATAVSTPSVAPRATETPTAKPLGTPPPTATQTPSPLPLVLSTPTPTAPPTQAPTPSSSVGIAGLLDGRTINLLVGDAKGSPADVLARVFANVAATHIPGVTGLIVRNVEGGGGLLGLSELISAQPDGLTIGPVDSVWFSRQLLGQGFEAFDLDVLNVVGSANASTKDNVFCVMKSSRLDWAAALVHQHPLGTAQVRVGDALGAAFLEAIGGPVKIIYGSGGISEIAIMVERGDIDASPWCSGEIVNYRLGEYLRQGSLVPWFWWGNPPTAQWLADVGAGPDLPNVLDLPGLIVSQPQRDAFMGAVMLSQLANTFVLPNGTESQVVEIWRDLFQRVVRDERFLSQLVAAGFEATNEIVTGDAISASLAGLSRLPSEGQSILQGILPR